MAFSKWKTKILWEGSWKKIKMVLWSEHRTYFRGRDRERTIIQ